MNDPIHSRGTGRSGPKRKTGCLTCRRRKVRCDEGRPVCANCIRLRLDCEYVPPKAKSVRSSSNATLENATAPRSLSLASHASFTDSQQSLTIGSSSQTMPSLPTTSYESPGDQWTITSHATSSFNPHFSDNFLPLETFDVGVGFPPNPEPFFAADSFGSAAHPIRPEMAGSNTNGISPNDAAINGAMHQQNLLDHFVQSVTPAMLFQPTHTEWTSTSRDLIAMADECAYVSSAIFSLSALHLYSTVGHDYFDEAFTNYRFAAREVNNVLDGAIFEDRSLKEAFAAIFLLTYAELLAQTTAKGKRNAWPLQHLQNFHHRVRQHNDRIRMWTGISKRLLTWTTILQSKAEWNSGNLSLQQSSISLSAYTGDPFARNPRLPRTSGSPNAARSHGSCHSGDEDLPGTDEEEDARSAVELAYDTFTQPSFDFFLKSQAFTSRILSLEHYDQKRGSLQMDLEMLKDGQRINTELHTLWANRPTTVRILHNPRGLEDIFQPHSAQRILLQLRVYVANFFAQFIHLHRVAFDAFPATADVENAVARIIELAKEILDSFPQRRKSETRSPSSPSSSRSTVNGICINLQDSQASGLGVELPFMMLWPLFLAATECGTADRIWILHTLRDIAKRSCPVRARVVFLLEELLRRQDQEGRRVDHRSVRKEIFDGDLSAWY